MKKIFIILFIFICFSIPAHASQSAEQYYGYMYDNTDSDVQRLLESFGLENGSYDEILNLNFRNVVQQFLSLCRNEMKQPLKSVLSAFILLTGITIIQALTASDDSVGDIISTIGTVLLTFTLFVPITACISDVVSVCVSTNDFTKVLIPVLAGIVTAAGKPTLAVCFQGFCFSSAQILTSVFRTSLPSICAVYTSLSVCGAMSSFVNTDKIAELIKKGYTMLLSFSAALFSALLSVKSVIAGCADTVTVKGVKFIVGNAVPVVGGALADALNSVISGISLLKSTVGVCAILILIFINLPTLIELLMWNITLKILNSAAGLLGRDADCKLISAFESLFTIMGAVVIFQSFLYIIAVSLLTIISGMG
ncbi:MAG: hypothetical protein E7523_03915 [Ruminococcaceae bacterium]|nr:hypothetical protein [Oscillospiraceae bacterium]